jgi:hypothetical protein
VPDDMKWMLDFDRAVDVGMGFRIDLSDAAARSGFDRIVVVGVKATTDAETGRLELETLLEHHRYGTHGIAILPQGTPTNNTEESGSGFSLVDEADETFDDLFLAAMPSRPVPSADWLMKTDGQWLAELLGIDPTVIDGIPHSAGLDQAEARRMNAALWPGTLGYWMDTMMNPVFPADVVEQTRTFFGRHVSGRGAIPAVRIGTQPYGILPTTAFSRTMWMDPGAAAGSSPAASEAKYLVGLRDVLRVASRDWLAFARQVSMVGGPGDPHKALLDVLSLHPTSATYASRHAESFFVALNRLRLGGLTGLASGPTIQSLTLKGRELLHAFGYVDGDSGMPEVLQQFQFTHTTRLAGPLVDAVPLSETAPLSEVAPLEGAVSGQNYIEWLVRAARTSFAALLGETGFSGGKPPTSLLYLLLRYALLEGYYDAGLQLRTGVLNLDPAVIMRMRRHIPTVRIDPEASEREIPSRIELLTLSDERVTGRRNETVAEHITRRLPTLPQARLLNEQIRALALLSSTPTARLERLFAEHVDCCGYRLDAWMAGLTHAQLTAMRGVRDGQTTAPRRGVLLGAYGWLLAVRPKANGLTPAQVRDPALRSLFDRPGAVPLMRDAANGGFIHAPSMNHAVAAAVLRSGYLANATPSDPGVFSVRLSSERVRRALEILDGMRGGQSLGELLGYRFERGLHERYRVAEVDQFILDLRREFPLRLDRIRTTKRSPEQQKDSIETRDVLDGERLAEHVRARAATGQSTSYPFGKTALPPANAAQRAAIDAEVDRLRDTLDAVADLLLAEGVYQAVHGNYDAVAAALDTTAGDNLPPDPEVIRTPSRGFPLTQRVALHLDPAASPNPRAGSTATPLSTAQPALNAWLDSVLPSPATIACKVRYRSSASHAVERDVTFAELGLQPIDVLRLIADRGGDELVSRKPRDASGDELASNELRDRIVYYLATTRDAPDLDGGVAKLTIDPGSARSTALHPLCRVVPLIRAVQSLVAAARPLKASDLSPSDEVASSGDQTVSIERKRVDDVRAKLGTLNQGLSAFVRQWKDKVDDMSDAADRTAVVPSIDTLVNDAMGLLVDASAFGVTTAGWRFMLERRSELAADLRAVLRAISDRWHSSLADYIGLMSDYDAITTPEDRFTRLEQAERRVSTSATPRPAAVDDLRAAIEQKRRTFEERLARIDALRDRGIASLSQLMADIRALSLSAFDPVVLDLASCERKMHAFAADVVVSIAAVTNELHDLRMGANDARGRIPAADHYLKAHDETADPRERVKALQAAGRALLGEDVTLIPDFGLADDQADEIANAVTDSPALLRYLTDVERVDFPVDEWLYTCARVRQPMQHWEQIVMLAGALGLPEPSLLPVQLPYRANDSWLAGRIPADYPADGERLLYTASFVKAYTIGQRQCGLLLDEWSEVIPLADRVPGETSRVPKQTTGVAFHFDRPNAQPPQAMLLVTPTRARGTWQWDDLLGAVNETIELARIRGVEPAQLDETPYAIFLPATTTAVSTKQATISALLHLNNVTLAGAASAPQ